jgi:hypothetical protein
MNLIRHELVQEIRYSIIAGIACFHKKDEYQHNKELLTKK